MVVPKKGRTWWVCVDYMNLNDVCPNNSFPLSRIVQIIDSTSGSRMLSFYHQIPIFCLIQEKMAFITPYGLYCYNIMLFGLTNVGAMYQRLMTKIFEPLMGRTREIYIDDIVVKIKTRVKHMQHLEEAFTLMQEYNMKLNPLKCAFGISTDKFFGFFGDSTRNRNKLGPSEGRHWDTCFIH